MTINPDIKMTTESTALTPSVTIENGEEIWGKAQWEKALETRYFPRGMTIDQAKLIACKGREMGIPRMRALNGLVVINNRVTMSAELMLGLIRERAFPMQLTMIERSASRACIKARRGFVLGSAIHWEEWSQFEFTEEDARRAGLWGKNTWASYPADMLCWRCVARMARFIFPDIIQGAMLPDEARGIVAQVEPEAVGKDFGQVLDGIAATAKAALAEVPVPERGVVRVEEHTLNHPHHVMRQPDPEPNEEEVDAAFEAQESAVQGKVR